MSKIQLSVIIPTYNRKEILRSCVYALFAQNISHNKYEILVIDDGSNDGTKKMIEDMIEKAPVSLRYFKQFKKGPAAAKNIGIKNSRGEIVLFINDDIIATPSLINEHLKFHDKNPDKKIAVLGYATWHPKLKITPFMYWLENGGPQFDYSGIDSGKTDWRRFYTCNISLKKDFLLTYGLFDEDFPYASYEDIELGYRLADRGLAILYNRNAIGYHYHKIDSVLKYCKYRRKIIGRSHWLFYQKHPELNFFEEQKIFNSLSPKIQKKIEKIIKTTRKIENLLHHLPVPNSEDLKKNLYSYYSIITDHYFLLGIAEGMGKDIPNFNKASRLCINGMDNEEEGNFDLAIKEYKAAKRLSRGFLPIIHLIARCYERMGHLEKANKIYISLLKKEGSRNHIKTRLNLTLNYLREKKRDKARREFKRILSCKLEENVLSIIHYHFGSILKKNGFLVESKKEFKEVLRLISNQFKDFESGAHFHLGEIFLAERDIGKAKEEFLECLRINPEHRKALKQLLSILNNRFKEPVSKKILIAS